MKPILLKLLKYEFKNLGRNKWMAVHLLFWFLISWATVRMTGDSVRSHLVLANFAVVFVPLVAVLFTSLHWYQCEQFTILMMTQPVRRSEIMSARLIGIVTSLVMSFVFGTSIGMFISGVFGTDTLVLLGISSLLFLVFSALAIWVCVLARDRMRGISIVFGIWLYFALIHDGLSFLLLTALGQYPTDLLAGTLGILNPLGLARVMLLMHFDAALLLGYSGAVVREYLTTWKGIVAATSVSLGWMTVSIILAFAQFRRRDF